MLPSICMLPPTLPRTQDGVRRPSALVVDKSETLVIAIESRDFLSVERRRGNDPKEECQRAGRCSWRRATSTLTYKEGLFTNSDWSDTDIAHKVKDPCSVSGIWNARLYGPLANIHTVRDEYDDGTLLQCTVRGGESRRHQKRHSLLSA